MQVVTYWPYQLESRSEKFGTRKGMLLKFVFSENLVGYADCHPWSELGDKPLDEQMLFASQHVFTTPNLERAKFFAQIDAEARANQKSLFEGLTIPSNHCLALDLETLDIQKKIDQNYKKFKFKISAQYEKDLPFLKKIFNQLKSTQCKVRLDFNSKLTFEKFENFLDTIQDYFQWIDFFEDPFPFDSKQWETIRKKYGVSLACDRDSERAINCPHAADVLVIKPAIQQEIPFLMASSSQKIVITSYLDHPLGQLSAAYIAAKLLQKTPHAVDICGLVSHHAYQQNIFSDALSSIGPDFGQPQGTGFGFDAILKKLPWREFS